MRVVILGTGGHAKSLAQFHSGAILTNNDGDVLPDDEVHIGVGDMKRRRQLFRQFRHQIPDRGVQLMAMTWTGPDVRLGDNVLVNTGAQIDHDCNIGAHSIISPAAVLCGNVTIGEYSFIGAGAIIVQGVTLEPESYVRAGTLVVGPDDMRVPQRVVRRNGAMEIASRPRGTRAEWDEDNQVWR